MRNNNGLALKDLLIRLVLIIIFIFLLIWLFPMPDLKPLNNQIFADNIDRMKDVAKSYYTTERLPQNINDSKKMTLREMLDKKLILPLMDSNGKYCSSDDSYIEVTKLENEYIIKVYLSCSDKQDYIIEHFGCYDICSDKCKALETTVTSGYAGDRTKKKTTRRTTEKIITTKKNAKLYEYQFVRTYYVQKFDKYSCPSGYYLVGDSCIKNGSEIITIAAKKKTTTITSIDTKDAKAETSSSTETTPANCRIDYLTSTQDAIKKTSTYSKVTTTTTQKVTADKTYTYDIKGAVETTTTVNKEYITTQNYDIISADKSAAEYEWVPDYTTTSTDGGLAYVGENSKLEYGYSWSEPTCATCATVRVWYKYYHYTKKTTGNATYSCDAYPGYSLYDGNKCRKATTTSKTCPSGYSPNGSVCSKQTTTYSCSKYGSSYEYNSSNKTCVKTTTKYSCPSGTSKTSDEKYCSKKVTTTSCPAGTTPNSNNTCDKVEYSCPSNTSVKTYTLNGSKCTVKSKVKVCSCPSGTVQTTDKTSCVKTNSKTTYTCKDYPGYTLDGKKCTKQINTTKVTYSCDAGYTLDYNTCVKTVSKRDCKAATKEYKTVSQTEYKWSTSTSISGWTYTGNKRQIN